MPNGHDTKSYCSPVVPVTPVAPDVPVPPVIPMAPRSKGMCQII